MISRLILFFFCIKQRQVSNTSSVYEVHKKALILCYVPFKDTLVEVRKGPTQGTEEILGLHRLGQGQQ